MTFQEYGKTQGMDALDDIRALNQMWAMQAEVFKDPRTVVEEVYENQNVELIPRERTVVTRTWDEVDPMAALNKMARDADKALEDMSE